MPFLFLEDKIRKSLEENIINEGKRDELLLPYYELVKDKIKSPNDPSRNIKLGEFKGIMLDKLSNEGCIKNLSLGSNFYLAGATKYYFQGMLTTDGKVGLLTGSPDSWNFEICKRLNTLIRILRNAYIDTIGTKFEQPEDFGTLTLPKLLRKYNKSIEVELGNDTYEEENKEPEDDGINRDPHVGNGYRFHIIYNYGEADMYREPTSPGAWCITYSESNYNMYIRRFSNYGGIHYVIFLQDGYENIPRETGPGYTKEKPHDAYGNSMIALLQRNDCWEPTFITSRWNHGHDETYGTEADYAYTLEEFCDITGVTPDDLKRIYEIWNADKEKYTKAPEVVPEKPELKKIMLSVKRKLSYAQMLINDGEKISTALTNAGVVLNRSVAMFGTVERLEKSIVVHKISEKNVVFKFMTDKNRILFDTLLIPEITDSIGFHRQDYGRGTPCVMVVKAKNQCLIYNGKYHEFLTIEGNSVFKKVPANTGSRGIKPEDKVCAFEVKQGHKDIALISTSDLRPIRFPSGRIWFNTLQGYGISSYRSREITCHNIYEGSPVVKAVMDDSSGESYFINMLTKKTFAPPVPLSNRPNNATTLKVDTEFFGVDGYYALEYGGTWYRCSSMLFNYKNERVSIYGKNEFSYLKGDYGRFISFVSPNDRDKYVMYDTKTKKMIAIGDKPVLINSRWGIHKTEDGKYMTIPHSYQGEYLYDCEAGLLLKNTIGYPERNEGGALFKTYGPGEVWNSEFDYWAFRNSLPDTLEYNEMSHRVDDERSKHLTLAINLPKEYFENTMQVNIETQEVQEPQYAGSIMAEEKIKKIVSEIIRKYGEGRRD